MKQLNCLNIETGTGDGELNARSPPLRAQWRTSAMQPERENFKASWCYRNSAEVRIWIESYRNVSLCLFKAASRLSTCAFNFIAASCKKNGVKSWLFMGIKGREWNSDYQVILGSEECLSEIGDALQTRHFRSDLHKEFSFNRTSIKWLPNLYWRKSSCLQLRTFLPKRKADIFRSSQGWVRSIRFFDLFRKKTRDKKTSLITIKRNNLK